MSVDRDFTTYSVAADFRLVHAPMSDDAVMPNLGHATLRAALTERLQHSNGGAMLIGGFRGAGKTTLVRQVVDELVATGESGRTWVSVRIDVAHPLSPTDLLYTVMRRLYEALEDGSLLGRLDAKVREAIGMAYLRTTASVATRRDQSRERSAGLNLAGLTPLGGLTPTIDLSSKKSESLGTDVSFLTYGDNDVEHDLLRIVDLLGRTPLRGTSWWSRRRGHVDPPVHVIVCLDELDKLTGSPAGTACLDELLVSLKNVLGAGNLHFLLVGGADLLDRALLDSEHGNGLFESVFAWTAYVPCLWQAPAHLVDSIVTAGPEQDLDHLRGYFQFKARGIPRRLLFELNGMVRWTDGQPQIRLDELDQLRVAFYARLNDVLEAHLRDQVDIRDNAERQGVEHDRFRLGAHFVIDWVLRSEGAVFVSTDIVQGRRALSALLDLAETDVAALLEHLADGHVLNRLNEPASPYETVFPGSPTTNLTRYRITSDVQEELRRLTRGSRRERADLLGDAGLGAGASDPTYGQPPVGQPGYGQPPYGQPSSYGPLSYGTTPYGQPSSSGQSSYPASPYGQAPPTVPSPLTTYRSHDEARPSYPLPGAPYADRTSSAAAQTGSIGPHSSEPAAANFTIPRDQQLMGGGRYQLIDLIGTGGMGMVYRARVVGTEQDVAVKVLPPWAVDDPALRLRFERETETIRSLDIPGVVTVYDLLHEPGGQLGIVMELADGTTLADAVANGPVAAHEAIRIVGELLSTVARLHERGFMRLDIKPSNIVLDAGRHPIVLDLGLAKPIFAESQSATTGVGEYVGTPAFSAPEQLRGEAVDQRVDIYACACVLFQLLGGDLTAGGSDFFGLMFRRVNDPHLDVDELPCSTQLRSVIATATAVSPDDRYSSAESFRDALLHVPEAAASLSADQE